MSDGYNLAGFDLIIEISRATVSDFILSSRLSEPSGDTLAPPFSLRRLVTTNGVTITAQFIVDEASIEASPGSADLDLRFGFTESSLEGLPSASGGRLVSLGLLVGDLVVKGSLSFSVPYTPGVGSALGLEFGDGTCKFDADTEARLDSDPDVGDSYREAIENELGRQFGLLFQSRGRQVFPDVSFPIVLGSDSRELLTFSKVPIVRWIDDNTLAVFGMHRADNDGDPALKTNSDLPAGERRGLAVLVSPEGFQLTLAPDAVASYVQDQIGEGRRNSYIDEERAAHGNTGPATEAEVAAADDRLRAYFESAEGQVEIARNTPPRYGQGTLPQPDNARITYMELSLEQGTIGIFVRAEADISELCGTAKVEQRMHATPRPSGGVINLGTPAKDAPEVQYSTNPLCEFIGSILPDILYGPVIGILGTFIVGAIIGAIAEHLIGSSLASRGAPRLGTTRPLLRDALWDDVGVLPSGLLLQGMLIGGLLDPVSFRPRVEIAINDEAQAASLPTFGVVDRLTGIACVAAPGSEFRFSRLTLDHNITLTLVDTDVPRPLSILEWTVQLGHKTDHRSIIYDPIRLTGERQTLSPGNIILAGEVWDPEPPLDGTVVTRQQIVVAADGGPIEFHLRTSASDLCYFLDVRVALLDGAGNLWQPTAMVPVAGEVIVLDTEATRFILECDAKLNGMNQRYAKSRAVPAWQTQIGTREQIETAIVSDIRQGRTGWGAILRETWKEDGQAALDQVFAQVVE